VIVSLPFFRVLFRIVDFGRQKGNCSDFQKMGTYLVASNWKSTRCWAHPSKKMASLNRYQKATTGQAALLNIDL
jgi:hypothetical protein